MDLVPNSPPVWQEFLLWHHLRKVPWPQQSHDALFVAHEGKLLAGVCMFPTDAGYVLVEHLSTNPQEPLRDRHGAVVVLASAVRVYCTVRGKHPIMVIRSRSIGRILQRLGYVYYPGAVFSAPLGVKL